ARRTLQNSGTGWPFFSKPPAHEGTPIVPSVHGEVQWEKTREHSRENRWTKSVVAVRKSARQKAPRLSDPIRANVSIAYVNGVSRSPAHIVAIPPASVAFCSSSATFASSELPPVKRVTASSR